MFRFCFLFTVVFFVGCSKQDASTGEGEVTAVELIYNSYLPAGDPVRETLIDDLARRMEQESAGAIKIYIPAASLSAASSQWSLLTDGVADIAMVPIWSKRNVIKLPSLAELPLNSFSAGSASEALWRTQQKYFSELNEFAGYKLLSMYTLAPSHLISSEKQIKSYDDLQNIKVWGTPGTALDVLKAVGATPVSSEYMQMYEYVSKGTVDAVMASSGGIKSAGAGTEVNYVTRIPGGLGSVALAVIMSESAWNGLNETQQQAVTRAAEGLPIRVGKTLDDIEKRVVSDFELTVYDADEAFSKQIHQDIQNMHSAWVGMATDAGLSNAQEAFDYYMEQMSLIETERLN